MAERPDVVLIAGPTASGKSALAIETARALDGAIVNADSMQVYDALEVVTARPGEAELAEAEHMLYGHVPAAQDYSVANWLEEAAAALIAIRGRGKTAIFVGGTGLYFKALEEGLSPIPEPDPAIRRAWREAARREPERLHGELAARDRRAAEALAPSDTQRLVRALEVFETTGRSILDWRAAGQGEAPLAGLAVDKWLIEIDRAELHRRIDLRFEQMLATGAIQEVERLLSLGLGSERPVMRAIGVAQLAGFLRGETRLEEAADKAKAASRQYAKRQGTWFRHQTSGDWQIRRM